MSDVAVRCAKCQMVRRHPKSSWRYVPYTLPGEVSGMCKLCAKLKARMDEWKREREGEKLLRDRAAGYGEAAEGVDVFQNLKGE